MSNGPKLMLFSKSGEVPGYWVLYPHQNNQSTKQQIDILQMHEISSVLTYHHNRSYFFKRKNKTLQNKVD